MNILIAPDKFKGSLTGLEVIAAIEAGIGAVGKNHLVTSQLLADGGEGTLEVLYHSLKLEKISLKVSGPLMRPTEAYYLMGEEVAYIEMAQASGLLLLSEAERNPLFTSTFGTGELILDALQRGAKTINLFVGGSATNDCGLGMAKALGYQFFDQKGNQLSGKGEDLSHVFSIQEDAVNALVAKTEFRVLTDVQNALLGDNGAAKIYGRQKGASENDINALEEGAKHLTALRNDKKELSPGAGAAGGLGYGAMTFLAARVESGIHFLMRQTQLEEKVLAADLVITGEGSIDHQTLEGKVIAGLYELCQKHGKPMAVVCGRSSMKTFDKSAIFQVMDVAESVEDAMANAGSYVSELSKQLLLNFRA